MHEDGLRCFNHDVRGHSFLPLWGPDAEGMPSWGGLTSGREPGTDPVSPGSTTDMPPPPAPSATSSSHNRPRPVHGSGGRSSETQAPAGLAPSEASLLDAQTATSPS